MKDYRGELIEFPYMLKHGDDKEYPAIAIGTFKRTYEELFEIFSAYPFNKLLVDTAFKYDNERAVGKALKDSGYPMEKVAFIGKICFSQQKDCKSIEYELNRSLERLGIDKIDFYLIHSPRYPGFVDTWRQMIKLKEKGLIEHIGVSNFGINDIEELYKNTSIRPDVNQIVFSPLNENDGVRGVINYCNKHQISIEAAMPFGGEDSSFAHSYTKREEIIRNLSGRGIVSVVGTSKIEHLLQDIEFLNLTLDG